MVAFPKGKAYERRESLPVPTGSFGNPNFIYNR